MFDAVAGLTAIIIFAAGVASATADDAEMRTASRAVFAGGCFWCMEPPFEKEPGVLKVISGYTGGRVENPTYEQVSHEATGHYEAVEVWYDPATVSYERLLEIFWHQVDPTDEGGQFVDRGPSYRSAVFYADERQRKAAEASKAALAATGRFGKPLVTPVIESKKFYPAEEYHQDYYKKNPIRYKYYRWGSGRDKFLERTWGGQ